MLARTWAARMEFACKRSASAAWALNLLSSSWAAIFFFSLFSTSSVLKTSICRGRKKWQASDYRQKHMRKAPSSHLQVTVCLLCNCASEHPVKTIWNVWTAPSTKHTHNLLASLLQHSFSMDWSPGLFAPVMGYRWSQSDQVYSLNAFGSMDRCGSYQIRHLTTENALHNAI